MELKREPRNKSKHLWSINLLQRRQEYKNGKKTVSSKTISSASASIVTAPLMLSPPPPSFTYRDSVIILDPLGDQRYSLKPICRAAMETQIWRTDLWTQWGRESGTNGESGREIRTLPYVNRVGENLLHHSGSSDRSSATTEA